MVKFGILSGHLPRKEAAAVLGKHERTLARWHVMRTGPPITFIGRTPYYKVESLEAWLEAQETG